MGAAGNFYAGVSSRVNATGTFVLVVGPEKISGVITSEKFDCFLKDMTPEDMLILPL